MPHSHLYENVPEPPNDATRIEMFLDAADSYAELAETYPLPRSFNLFGSAKPADYWLIVLHAGVLRKFFYPKDQVSLAKVMDSLDRMAKVNHPVMAGDLVEFRKVAHARSVPIQIGLRVGDHDVTQWEVVEVELHGRHLHTDWGKWQASKRVRSGGWEIHMGQWCNAASFLVKAAEMKIRWYQEEGFIE